MPKNIEDLIDSRRGKVVVVDNYGVDPDGKRLILCKCDCGKQFIVKRSTFLSAGYKGHCGCEKHRNCKDHNAGPTLRSLKKTIDITTKLTEENIQSDKYKETCANIKAWMLALRSGAANCKVGAVRYVKQS